MNLQSVSPLRGDNSWINQHKKALQNMLENGLVVAEFSYIPQYSRSVVSYFLIPKHREESHDTRTNPRNDPAIRNLYHPEVGFICIIRRSKIFKLLPLTDLQDFSRHLNSRIYRRRRIIITTLMPQMKHRLIREEQEVRALNKFSAVCFLNHYNLTILACYITLHLNVVKDLLGLQYIPSTAELCRVRKKHGDFINEFIKSFRVDKPGPHLP